jgi:hypothetical protein
VEGVYFALHYGLITLIYGNINFTAGWSVQWFAFFIGLAA